MSTAEIKRIKQSLIEWIHKLSDADILTFLDGLQNATTKENWWQDLSPEERKILESGINDAEKGNMISTKEFWLKVKNA